MFAIRENVYIFLLNFTNNFANYFFFYVTLYTDNPSKTHQRNFY